MAIQTDKIMNLADGKLLYDDLRQRIEQGGGGNASIDDTAGAGDTDKVWSADKLVTEFNGTVSDVKVNGSSVVTSGVANVPVGGQNTFGVFKAGGGSYGIDLSNGTIITAPAGDAHIKAGSQAYRIIAPSRQHLAAFYGLAKAAGHDEKNSANSVGTYTDEAKAAIQTMLGTNSVLAPVEADNTADAAYAIGEVFSYNGKLYKATSAIAVNDVIVPGTNCTETTVMLTKATNTSFGLVKVRSGDNGLQMNGDYIVIYPAQTSDVKGGTHSYRCVSVNRQHEAVFYGLAKVAGADLASATVTVGTYPDNAKTAIQNMIGVNPVEVVRLA